jgi:hypothetical protein
MRFDSDVFISYAHLDNQALLEGQKGWVANFHRALEIRVSQLLGKEPTIWRDPKLTGSDFFADTLVDRVRHVAVLLTVVSPRYAKSEWTLRELNEFVKSASEKGGLRVGEKTRLLKVMKTPVPLDQQPQPLQQMLGYEFYRLDPETGRVRELDQVFGPEAQRDFWMKLDDVAHDLSLTLETLYQESHDPARPTLTVYLADTTSDLRGEYDSVRRDLQEHGCRILPSRPLPLQREELESFVRAELEECDLSIHLVGRHYGLVPEGGLASLVEIQNDMAIERGRRDGFRRLVWVPPGLDPDDPRQLNYIEGLRTDPRLQHNADLLESPLEDFRTVVLERLEAARQPAPDPVVTPPPADDELVRIYVICDQRDQETVQAWSNHLFDRGFEAIPSVFEGDETEVREYHEESLRICDAVLILYAAGNDCWIRRKLREVQKIAGYGRTDPMRGIAVCVAPPNAPGKAQFRTHEAMVIQQSQGFAPEALEPFLSRLRTTGGVRRP